MKKNTAMYIVYAAVIFIAASVMYIISPKESEDVRVVSVSVISEVQKKYADDRKGHGITHCYDKKEESESFKDNCCHD